METTPSPPEWAHLWYQYLIPLLEIPELHRLSQTNRWFNDVFKQEATWRFLLSQRLPLSMRLKDTSQTDRQFFLKMCHLKPIMYTWTQYDQELCNSLGPCHEYDTIIGQIWTHNGEFHRLGDLPAVISPDGTNQWYFNGKNHRMEDQPAIIFSNGTKIWFQQGLQHRDDDKPSAIYADGGSIWCQHGQQHRDNDQPAVIGLDGRKQWFQKGRPHRDNDKPAVIWPNGTKEWWFHGQFIRSVP